MTEDQFLEITRWQAETFPQATAISAAYHLQSEVNELIIDLAIDGLGKTMEFADCFLLLFGAAFKDGMSYQDICKAIDEKMSINKQRKWGKANEQGFVEHIS